MKAIRENVPGARIVLIEGAATLPCWRHPSASANLLLVFRTLSEWTGLVQRYDALPARQRYASWGR